MCEMSPAVLDDNLPRLGIAAAHKSAPVTEGCPSKQPTARQDKQTNKKGDMDPDTHSCSDWRQLHESVRTDGADIPRRSGSRVRRGDPRSNQQPGIHSWSRVVNESSLCVKQVEQRSGESLCAGLRVQVTRHHRRPALISHFDWATVE